MAFKFPRTISVGAATGKLYRTKNSAAAGGFLYEARAGGKKVKSGTDATEVERELRVHLTKLNAGEVEAAGFTKADRDELLEARRLAHPVPVLAALREWLELKEKLAAKLSFTPCAVGEVRDLFIAQGNKAGLGYERTYKSKLKRLSEVFPGREIHGITTLEMTAFLEHWTDQETRRDIRKRCITLWRWAQRMGYIAKDASLSPAETIRIQGGSPKIGVVVPSVMAQLLMYVEDYHPEYLAALVLAGFMPLRVGEVHGSRDDPDERQSWSDIHLSPDNGEPPFLNVTAAKPNTPAWRRVPIPSVAAAWLARSVRRDDGLICGPFALDRVRHIAAVHGLEMPDNGLRHAVISYDLAIHKNKPRIALDAGTSVARIDRNYRRPVPLVDAQEWQRLTPEHCRRTYTALRQLTHEEISRLGGQSKSPAKIAAVIRNLKEAKSASRATPETLPRETE